MHLQLWTRAELHRTIVLIWQACDGRSLCRDCQIIEVSYGIRLCPEADLAGFFESVVSSLDLLGAVKITGELVSREFHAKFVPGSGTDLEIGACELDTPAFHNVVEPVIIFERVGTNDVVIFGILQTKHQTAGLVDTAGNGFEFNADVQVAKRAFVANQ